MKIAAVFLIVVALLACGVGCEVWQYRECRKVGHGRLYCWAHVGSK